ncbi:hypothetical protein, partial [Aeromonas eucrenophila]
IRYPLSAIRYPLSAIRYPLSAIRYPLSAIRYPLSVIRYPLSALPEIKPWLALTQTQSAESQASCLSPTRVADGV